MSSREEQETIVTMGRVADHMSIWTNNIVHVRTLEKEDRAKRISPDPDRIKSGDLSAYLEEGWGAEYHVKAEDARILGVFGRKVKPKTEEQRKAAGERLRAARGEK